jgi:simple sugar transport system permease protein
VGFSKTAAKYAGINVGKCVVISMTISGALGGLAGVTYYLGYLGSIQPKVLVDTGYDAIAVSLLGNNNPFGIIFSTMLITLISKGSTYMKSTAGVDSEIASVITGVILLFSACNAYIKWKAANIRARKSLPVNSENHEKIKAGKEEK